MTTGVIILKSTSTPSYTVDKPPESGSTSQ